MKVYETRLTLTDERDFDGYLHVLGLLKPGHEGSTLSLTLLPPALESTSRVLWARAHYHRETKSAHWMLNLVTPPNLMAPAEVVEVSDRLGGIGGFIERFVKRLPEPMACNASVHFDIETAEHPCQFLPGAVPGPPGATETVHAVSWLFRQPHPLESLGLSVNDSAPRYSATVGLSLRLAPKLTMFTEVEEKAWSAFGTLLETQTKRPGKRTGRRVEK
jgi:hypothetical protein